jgi:hypothetical protein
MQPYQTKFLAFLNSVWEESPEAEPRVLAAVLSCAPFLEIPDAVSRQRVRGLTFIYLFTYFNYLTFSNKTQITLRVVRSLAWAAGEERSAAINALALMMAKYGDEVLVSSLSAVLSHLEDLPEQVRLGISISIFFYCRKKLIKILLFILAGRRRAKAGHCQQ